MPDSLGEIVFGEYPFGGEGVGGGGGGDPLPTSNQLGRAESGQLWFGNNNWSIEESDNPSALIGMSTILPIFHAEDRIAYTGQTIESQLTGDPPTRFGLNGRNTAGPIFYIDRPTRILVFAFANYSNESAVDAVNIRFYLSFQINDSATLVLGRQTNAYSPISDPGYRLLATSHEKFIDASPDDIKKVHLQWAYYQSSAFNRQATIRNQRMDFILAYAPDYSPSLFNTRKRPRWSRDGNTRRSYRRAEGDD